MILTCEGCSPLKQQKEAYTLLSGHVKPFSRSTLKKRNKAYKALTFLRQIAGKTLLS